MGPVKRLLVLLVVVALGAALYRRMSGLRAAAPSRPHRHGTPDHWPPVVRKPGPRPTPTAPSAPAA